MSKARRKKPAGRKYPVKRSPPKRDPEQEAAIEAATAMVEIMSCPVLVAQEQAERCSEMMALAVEAADLGLIAQRLHVDQPSPPLSPLLIELVTTLQQHARDLASLIDRLAPMIDHDTAHEHVELDDDTVKQILVAMFDPEEAR